jgi:predicted nucleic acid-binding protein
VSEGTLEFPGPQRVVLADANVLYSRVLRDYLLYAASQEIVNIVWSSQILDEVVEHMMANLPAFDRAAANHLLEVLERAYPAALIDPAEADYQRLEGCTLPDEDDRHVIAAALAAEADAICTNDKAGFPAEVLDRFEIDVLLPDDLICQLIEQRPAAMLAAHHTAVKSLGGATDESTLAALQRAHALKAAKAMQQLLTNTGPTTSDTNTPHFASFLI